MKTYEIDCNITGVAILKKSDGSFFIDKKSGKIKLFTNISVARYFAVKQLNLVNREYELYFVLDNDNSIAVNKAQLVNGIYECFYNEEKIFIKENKERIVETAGYIILGEEPIVSNKDDKKANIEIQRNNMKCIRGAAKYLAQSTALISNVSKQNGCITIYFRNGSAELNICFNSNIAFINKERKEGGRKPLPFDKTMGWFSTFYLYGTVSKDEFDKTINEKMDYIIEQLILELKYEKCFGTDPHYKMISKHSILL